MRRSSTFCPDACSSVDSSTGVSEGTQVSLLLPPRCMEMKCPLALRATRASRPPGITRVAVAVRHEINAQRDRPRHESRCRPSDGAVENSTRSCATNRSGSNSMRRRKPSRSFAVSGFSGSRVRACDAKRRFHDQLVQIFQHVFARGFLAAPPRRHRRQFQFLAEQMPAQARQKRHERRALHQAAAERVGDGRRCPRASPPPGRARRASNHCAIPAGRRNHRPRGAESHPRARGRSSVFRKT